MNIRPALLSITCALTSGWACAEVYDVAETDAAVGAPEPPGGAAEQTGPSPPSRAGDTGDKPSRVDPEPPTEVAFADAGAAPAPPDESQPPSDDDPLPPDDDPVPPAQDEPAPPQEDPPAPSGPCQGIDFIGECQGTVLRYCDGNSLVVWDCAWTGQPCGWVDAATGYDCGGHGVEPGGGGDSPSPAPSPPVEAGDCGSAEETRVVDLVNAARAAQGLGGLQCDPAGVQAAQAHSDDQCAMGFMSHTGSDGSDAGDRLRRAGGNFGGWGENVAYGADTPEGVHDMWMNSPGHYANIMGGFARIGVGLAPCGGTYYWTEVFMD